MTFKARATNFFTPYTFASPGFGTSAEIEENLDEERCGGPREEERGTEKGDSEDVEGGIRTEGAGITVAEGMQSS